MSLGPRIEDEGRGGPGSWGALQVERTDEEGGNCGSNKEKHRGYTSTEIGAEYIFVVEKL